MPAILPLAEKRKPYPGPGLLSLLCRTFDAFRKIVIATSRNAGKIYFVDASLTDSLEKTVDAARVATALGDKGVKRTLALVKLGLVFASKDDPKVALIGSALALGVPLCEKSLKKFFQKKSGPEAAAITLDDVMAQLNGIVARQREIHNLTYYTSYAETYANQAVQAIHAGRSIPHPSRELAPYLQLFCLTQKDLRDRAQATVAIDELRQNVLAMQDVLLQQQPAAGVTEERLTRLETSFQVQLEPIKKAVQGADKGSQKRDAQTHATQQQILDVVTELKRDIANLRKQEDRFLAIPAITEVRRRKPGASSDEVLKTASNRLGMGTSRFLKILVKERDEANKLSQKATEILEFARTTSTTLDSDHGEENARNQAVISQLKALFGEAAAIHKNAVAHKMEAEQAFAYCRRAVKQPFYRRVLEGRQRTLPSSIALIGIVVLVSVGTWKLVHNGGIPYLTRSLDGAATVSEPATGVRTDGQQQSGTSPIGTQRVPKGQSTLFGQQQNPAPAPGVAAADQKSPIRKVEFKKMLRMPRGYILIDPLGDLEDEFGKKIVYQPVESIRAKKAAAQANEIMGNYAQAVSEIQDALVILDSIQDRVWDYGLAKDQLEDVLTKCAGLSDQPEKAIDAVIKRIGREESRAANSNSEWKWRSSIASKIDLSALYAQNGQLTEAEKLIIYVKSKFEDKNEIQHSEYFCVCYNLAFILEAEGNYSEALNWATFLKENWKQDDFGFWGGSEDDSSPYGKVEIDKMLNRLRKFGQSRKSGQH